MCDIDHEVYLKILESNLKQHNLSWKFFCQCALNHKKNEELQIRLASKMKKSCKLFGPTVYQQSSPIPNAE
nr:hypothetical transcript [Hymenolepis microstoma]